MLGSELAEIMLSRIVLDQSTFEIVGLSDVPTSRRRTLKNINGVAQAPRVGLEPTTRSTESPLAIKDLQTDDSAASHPIPHRKRKSAPSAIPIEGERSGIDQADLARIVDAWPTLPKPIRRAMLALVESAG
jgi:hypothetical protein